MTFEFILIKSNLNGGKPNEVIINMNLPKKKKKIKQT